MCLLVRKSGRTEAGLTDCIFSRGRTAGGEGWERFYWVKKHPLCSHFGWQSWERQRVNHLIIRNSLRIRSHGTDDHEFISDSHSAFLP